jgi:hypothetical protein
MVLSPGLSYNEDRPGREAGVSQSSLLIQTNLRPAGM